MPTTADGKERHGPLPYVSGQAWHGHPLKLIMCLLISDSTIVVVVRQALGPYHNPWQGDMCPLQAMAGSSVIISVNAHCIQS